MGISNVDQPGTDAIEFNVHWNRRDYVVTVGVNGGVSVICKAQRAVIIDNRILWVDVPVHNLDPSLSNEIWEAYDKLTLKHYRDLLVECDNALTVAYEINATEQRINEILTKHESISRDLRKRMSHRTVSISSRKITDK